MKYKGWSNKLTCKVAEAIDNNPSLFNEVMAILEKFPSDDFRTLMIGLIARDIRLESTYIDPDELINREELVEHYKRKL